MIAYIKRKLARRAARTHFHEYGTTIKKLDVPGYGTLEYAQWLHPLEGPKEIKSENINFYKSLCREGGMIIDIGAHTGDTTVPMALAAGKKGLVLALEPNPYVFKVLEENSKLNRELTNIDAHCIAATAEDGTFQFNYSDASFCNGGFLSQIHEQNHGHKYTLDVKGKNLQQFLLQNYRSRLDQLDLVKVDAEGYDKEILKTIPDILDTYKPNLMLECYKRLTTEERGELFDVVDQHGYDLFRLTDFNVGSPRTKLAKSDMETEKHFEMLAIHRSRA